jgi:hypothetical protein
MICFLFLGNSHRLAYILDCMICPCLYAALLSDLHGAAQSSSAVSFLAQTVKDFGAVDAAIELYAHAYQSPDAQKEEKKLANMALNLAHAQEVPARACAELEPVCVLHHSSFALLCSRSATAIPTRSTLCARTSLASRPK